MAVRFSKLFGKGAVLWANMQSGYDLWHAARNVDTTSIPTLEVAYLGQGQVDDAWSA